MRTKITLSALGALLLVTSQVFSQDTFFFTGFEYDDVPFIIEPADMNGADDQVGEWSGDEFPEGQGDILIAPDSVGVVPSPFGGEMLLLDRPSGDLDGNDLTGSYFGNLTEAIPLIGTEVSFQVGTRRTGGNQEKAYDVVGRSSGGDEVFRVRIGANNGGGNRLGFVNSAGDPTFDLPTVVGEDKHEDLGNIGGFSIDAGPGANQEIANILLRLGPDGYAIGFSYPEESTSARANAYETDIISYNSAADDLAQLEFTYEASTANGRNSGYVLDEILVTGIGNVLLGDFDANGTIDTADFNILATNFGTGTTLAEGDINFDGQVNLKDFADLKQAFSAQSAGAAASVPEPSSGLIAMLGLCVLTMLRRRRLAV